MSSLSKDRVALNESGKLFGYLSRPSNATPPRPAIIIIHEWWGLTPHMKDVSDRYASLGYVVLAPDLFGGVTTTVREEAMNLSASVSMQESAEKIGSAMSYLKQSSFVKPDQIGILGFCFGGMHEFHFLCVSSGITVAAIYYPSRVPSDDLLAKITMPLLLIYGDQDYSIKSAYEVEATLRRLQKNAELLVYPGAGHAFFNDTWQNYKQEAAKDAWKKTTAFFASHIS
jgi:carboxymethylenebutenolidase